MARSACSTDPHSLPHLSRLKRFHVAIATPSCGNCHAAAWQLPIQSHFVEAIAKRNR
jgi:hypothetical protein